MFQQPNQDTEDWLRNFSFCRFLKDVGIESSKKLLLVLSEVALPRSSGRNPEKLLLDALTHKLILKPYWKAANEVVLTFIDALVSEAEQTSNMIRYDAAEIHIGKIKFLNKASGVAPNSSTVTMS
ncbi:hypothetical protein V6N11_079783 [Hibiscus sabdariffa]|uniref:Uncharacterized protein n=1 Tax=Hibiscus sabdariffa TaxID=183260 RepID=A0ABR2RX65_9ROSI